MSKRNLYHSSLSRLLCPVSTSCSIAGPSRLAFRHISLSAHRKQREVARHHGGQRVATETEVDPLFGHFPSSSRALPFKPPPIRTRLRPLIPFFIYWCIVTSLAVHLLRARIRARESEAKSQAKISVLEGLIERLRNGEKLGEADIRREMELVGLRDRQLPKSMDELRLDIGAGVSNAGMKQVSWMEALLGRRKADSEIGQDEAQVITEAQMGEEILGLEEWARAVGKPAQTVASKPSVPVERTGVARRAPSSSVYL